MNEKDFDEYGWQSVCKKMEISHHFKGICRNCKNKLRTGSQYKICKQCDYSRTKFKDILSILYNTNNPLPKCIRNKHEIVFVEKTKVERNHYLEFIAKSGARGYFECCISEEEKLMVEKHSRDQFVIRNWSLLANKIKNCGTIKNKNLYCHYCYGTVYVNMMDDTIYCMDSYCDSKCKLTFVDKLITMFNFKKELPLCENGHTITFDSRTDTFNCTMTEREQEERIVLEKMITNLRHANYELEEKIQTRGENWKRDRKQLEEQKLLELRNLLFSLQKECEKDIAVDENDDTDFMPLLEHIPLEESDKNISKLKGKDGRYDDDSDFQLILDSILLERANDYKPKMERSSTIGFIVHGPRRGGRETRKFYF